MLRTSALVLALLLAGLVLPNVAQAVALSDCARWQGDPAIADGRIDGKATTTYANGAITVALLQRADGYFLALWTRVRRDGIERPICRLVSSNTSTGGEALADDEELRPFTSIDWEGRESAGDAAAGLTVNVPATHTSPGVDTTAPDWRIEFDLFIDGATGSVVVEREERLR